MIWLWLIVAYLAVVAVLVPLVGARLRRARVEQTFWVRYGEGEK